MTTNRNYNAQELKDLLAAKDAEISGTLSAFSQIESSWQQTDPTSESAWYQDWEAFKARYDSTTSGPRNALAQDELAASLPLVSLTSIDETYNYQRVLLAVNRNWPGQWQAGDLTDLETRLTAAYSALGQSEPVTPIPQPTPGSDSGLDPTSWEGYVTGAAAKLGLVQNPPPGTPGTIGGPPLIPTWLKWGALGGAVLWGVAKVKEIF